LISLYVLMKENIHYAGLLAAVLVVFVASGPVSFATTELTQTQGTMNQTQTSQNGTVTVAIGEGSNATVQYYTYTPHTVEINAGESVTWVSPADLSDIHTVTFVLDQNVISDIILPFAMSGNTSFELVPPFNIGDPITIQAPDGREAIVALNKQAWNPAVVDANNQTTYLNGTDIHYTMDGTEKVINSGILIPQPASMNEAVDQNSSSAATDGEAGAAAATNETASMNNTTNQATEGGQPQLGPPFPPVSSFTLTFEEPGRYAYFCAIHPWMSGEVIVRGEGDGQNQTQTQ
jgi:plastocyanin